MRTPAEIVRAAREALGLSPSHELELLALLNRLAEHESAAPDESHEWDGVSPSEGATQAEGPGAWWQPAAAFVSSPRGHSPKGLDLGAVNLTIPPEATPSTPPDDSVAQAPIDESCEDELLGRYSDLGLLGMGGMGEVRLVRDGQLKRNVAMKILHWRLMVGGDAVRRFVDEAVVVAQLQHPNVVPIHELGWLPDGRPYFTMKPIRGQALTKSIEAVHAASDHQAWYPAADGTSFRQLIRIFHQVCVTVAYAHSTGVVHRDIKPQNIMTGAFNDVLVVDWGLAVTEPVDGPNSGANETESNAKNRRIMGTPAYMSPEQAYGRTEAIGVPTDIYSLGAVLYEIISGRPPFRGKSNRDVVKQVRQSAPEPLSGSFLEVSPGLVKARFSDQVETSSTELSPKIPPRLIEICERAMQREIEHRYGNVDALGTEVLDWLESAEKRDRGIQEVEMARIHHRKAQQQRLVGLERWQEANSLFNQEGAESKAGWLVYEEAVDAQAQARLFEDLHAKHLEAALVHAPGLREAHHGLAERAFGELNLAFGLGDSRALSAAQQRLERHMDFLSPAIKTSLEDQYKSLLGDPILTQCIRRGALVGREEERRLIVSLLGARRQLITLVGTPGVGKTRIALDLAAELRAVTSQTYFCDLSEAQDEFGVLQLVARSLGLRLNDGEPLEHLSKRLGQGSVVLVLDNLEHIRDIMRPICRDWVANLGALNIIATSRVRLEIEGEQVVEIAPMTLLEGVELFVRCAQEAVPEFHCSAANRARLCELVEALDGLPLAIELAASRLRMMTLDEIVERLGQRFSLLRSRAQESVALEAALDWSWELLAQGAQATLAQSSVFRGGFNLTAAEQVVVFDERGPTPAIFDVLEELVDASLLQKVRLSDSSIRYQMLQSVRAYARMRLEVIESTGSARIIGGAQTRHATFFSSFGEAESLETLHRDHDGRGMARYVEDLDNLVVAIDYGTADVAALCCLASVRPILRHGPAGSAVAIAAKVLAKIELSGLLKVEVEIAMAKCLWRIGRVDEARALLEAVGEAVMLHRTGDVSGTDVGTARDWAMVEIDRYDLLGSLESHQSNIEMADHLYGEALKAALKYKDRPKIAKAREGLAVSHYARAEFDQAFDGFRSVLKIYQELDYKLAASRINGNLGLIDLEQGRFDEAVVQFSVNLRLSTELGDRLGEATSLSRLAGVHRTRGEVSTAIEHYKRSIRVRREYGDRRGEGMTLGNLGLAYQNRGDYELAIETAKDALKIHRELSARRSIGITLGGLGRALSHLERHEEAEAALREAISICDEVVPQLAGWVRGDLAKLLAKMGALEEARALLEKDEAYLHGRFERNGAFLCCRGFVDLVDGQPVAAIAALDKARALALELRCGAEGDLAQAIRELETAITEASDENAK